jgi:hypothetical protein
MVNSLFLLTLLLLAYAGAIGFGKVWMRHRVSVSANASKVLEQEIADVQRRLADASAKIAVARGTDQLLRLNAQLGLNLVQPSEEQVIRTRDDVELRLAAKRFERLLSGGNDQTERAAEVRHRP